MSAFLDKLKKGDFNTMNWEGQPDGIPIITLSKTGEATALQAKVKDLNQPTQEVIWEKEIPA